MNEKINFCLRYFYFLEWYKKYKTYIRRIAWIILIMIIFSIGYNLYLYKQESNVNKIYIDVNNETDLNIAKKDNIWINRLLKNKNYDNTHRLLIRIASIDSTDIKWDKVVYRNNVFILTGKAKNQKVLRSYIDSIHRQIREVQWNESQKLSKESKGVYFSLSGKFENNVFEN